MIRKTLLEGLSPTPQNDLPSLVYTLIIKTFMFKGLLITGSAVCHELDSYSNVTLHYRPVSADISDNLGITRMVYQMLILMLTG